MIAGPTEIAAAKRRIRQLLIDHGFDPDHEPQGHAGKAQRDILLFGTHFDRVDPITGAPECLESDQIAITRDPVRLRTWLTADEARQYAVEHGGASFSICPACDARYPSAGPAGLLEAVLRQHCESHTPEEWLRALGRLQARIDRALDVCGSGVNALLEPGPLKRRVSAARVRAALRGTGGL